VTLDVAAPDDAVEVVGDDRQLVSALANLLDNAVKYSEPGSTVRATVTTGDGWLDVAVTDQGVGIPAKDLARIFERFYRVDRARSRATGGTGLGLSIVRHVVANHDGDVRVESREGEGSTFTVRLPWDGR
jgi:two-component system sensor histidine kinase SenX3